ncbi:MULTISPECIES: D-aminoacyl-tRNA deacylase [Corynebacterium]|uniref:D-aminoacyl-tRNA deacylase n=1 Tax=Corynebacterium amycolatum TaxID=43765 RepID=A0AB38XSW7_CORAY|nr:MULTISPECIES: D-aminoacyl-tRNA deacylase [Corynebacterium]AIN82535.1 D-tyrosyl-tRNA(Tyr) deacylase [Corynebacterium sp. ATCC 6931]KAA9287160.1 D-tyrosyl-tRNA(Tyr) deacylase [Corynebacterium amycolatum]MBC6726871.1 D-tyrosyl-tRNA(Tyr) deacylase [Corynebacterium amycolatum]MBC6758132.1 D-tyrosyl-tRNA(Tyr) deacylase [Corynebacterium sp. LK24]MCG7244583.1 D-aminoacyl-tRNA deacylase [Corynebacterium sp. ACRPX]
MKAVLTRVKSASVTVDGSVVGHVDGGDTGAILALVGVGREDSADAWETMARKIAELRILDGELSAVDAGAQVLVVSQFTLMGATKKGRRPSWVDAAPGPEAEPVIEKIVENLRNRGLTVETGQFGAMMEVTSVNDGPFTVLVEC